MVPGALVHARVLNSNADVKFPVLKSLFNEHCEIDLALGSLMKESAEHFQLVASVLCQLAREGWRSNDGTKRTVIHVVLTACRIENLWERGAVQLAHALLRVDRTLINTADAHGSVEPSRPKSL